MEDKLSALGLVLNCVVLWNTVYMDRALDQLRAQDHPVLDADVARLSAFIRDWLAHGPKTKGNLKLEVDIDPQSFL